MRCCLLMMLLVAGCTTVEARPQEKPALPRDVVDAIIRQADSQAAMLTRLEAIEKNTEDLSAIRTVLETKPKEAEPEVKSSNLVPLYVSSTAGCAPCQRLKDDLDAGKFNGFDVKFVEDPGVSLYPRIRYEVPGSPGQFAWVTGYNASTISFLTSRLIEGETNAADEGAKTGSGQGSVRVATPTVSRRTSGRRGLFGFLRGSNCSTGTCR